MTRAVERLWATRTWQDLSRDELHAVLKLRQDIFIVEQKCCYADADGRDCDAVHMLVTIGDELVGCQRVFAPGLWCSEAAISRIVIAASHRGQGIGEELVRRGVELCRRNFPGAGIRIGAQAHLESFYQRNGFYAVGEVRPVDGIPHVDMLWADPDSAVTQE